VFSHNGPSADAGFESSMWEIIHRDSPGGAAKLRAWGWSLMSSVALFCYVDCFPPSLK